VAPDGAVPAKVVVEPAGFRDFWTAYPRKVARGRAEAAYRQAVKKDGPVIIAVGLASWAGFWSVESTEEKFIPHPTTFLNQARYLDRPPAARVVEPRGFPALRRVMEAAAERQDRGPGR
jgi:hypothetical protein